MCVVGMIALASLLIIGSFAKESSSLSWEARESIEESLPSLVVAMLINLIVDCILYRSVKTFARALPSLELQTLTVTATEIFGHNGIEFFIAPIYETTKVYADKVNRNIKEGRYTNWRLTIAAKDKSIEFYCFAQADLVANAINAILFGMSEKSALKERANEHNLISPQAANMSKTARIICERCGKEYSTSSCPHCGFRPENDSTWTCHDCGKKISKNTSFCTDCGSYTRR
ncbi:MAG: hypothetical protein FWH17_04770 [Oscillospiraceae bacterium]|nr:hypothetical protein [Oscillospiraceae bacterium]